MTINSINGSTVLETGMFPPVRVASTGSPLNPTVGGLLVVDGVQLVAGDRVLCKDETNPINNGIYSASTGPWVRSSDASGNQNFFAGMAVTVALGAVNAGLTFLCTCTDDPVVIGTSNLTFAAQAVVASATQMATSTSSLAIGTGSKTFAIQSGKAFQAGQWVLAQETSNAANQMLGKITSYSGTSLVISVVAIGGSGTHADWTIVLTNSPAAAGYQPPTGSGNVTGPGTSGTGNMVTFADGTGLVLADSGAIAPFSFTNGQPTVGGVAASIGQPATTYWDPATGIIWVCTNSGSSAPPAVWTPIIPASATPQGYLTLTSGTPVISSDVIAATTVYYTPKVGNRIGNKTFSELSCGLVSAHASNTLYDFFVTKDGATLGTGPAWSNSNAGSGARSAAISVGSDGLLTNTSSMTLRTGSSTQTIGAGGAWYVGTMAVDGTAGQVTCHVAWGASRKWGIYNAYQQEDIVLQAGITQANWSYGTATWRSSHNDATATAQPCIGRTTQIEAVFTQLVNVLATSGGNSDSAGEIGIGLNATNSPSGTTGYLEITIPTAGTLGNSAVATARLATKPTIGINNFNQIESGVSSKDAATFFGASNNMMLTVKWRG